MQKVSAPAAHAPALAIRCVDSTAEWDRIEASWNALADAQAVPTPFTSWEWARTWWSTFGGANFELCILVCSAGDEIVGIAPLIVASQAKWPLRPNKLRVLRLIASGEPDIDSVVTEYGDVLVAPGAEAAVGDAFAAWLCSPQAPRWDAFALEHTLDSSTVRAHVLPALERRGRPSRVVTAGVRYYLPLDKDWKAYLSVVGGNMRNKLTVGRRRMEKAGGYEVINETDPERMPEALRRLAVLHRRRWQLKDHEGAFDSPRFSAFHDTVASSLARRGRAHVVLIRVKGQDVAAVYSLASPAGVFFYQTGFDPALAENFSPGTVVIGVDIENAMLGGKQFYDFMGSAAGSYKLHYGAATAALDHAFVFNHSLRGRASRSLLALQQWRARRKKAVAATSEPSEGTASTP